MMPTIPAKIPQDYNTNQITSPVTSLDTNFTYSVYL